MIYYSVRTSETLIFLNNHLEYTPIKMLLINYFDDINHKISPLSFPISECNRLTQQVHLELNYDPVKARQGRLHLVSNLQR